MSRTFCRRTLTGVAMLTLRSGTLADSSSARAVCGMNATVAVRPAQVVDDPSSCAQVPSRTF